MIVETVPIGSVMLDPANVRLHPTPNVEAIKGSLTRFGQQKPIVVDAQGIVRAGNGTLVAAKSLGWTEIKIVRSALVGPDATAYSIADNRTGDLSTFDDLALAKTLDSIKRSDEQLFSATGYDDAGLTSLLESIGKFDVSPVEPPALPSGDKAPFQQMTFTLHDMQAESVKQAVAHAIKEGEGFEGSPNENSNGNALALICEAYLGRG